MPEVDNGSSISSPSSFQRPFLARILRLSFVGLWFGVLILLGFFGWQWFNAQPRNASPANTSPAAVVAQQSPAATATQTPTSTETATLAAQNQPSALAPEQAVNFEIRERMIVSMDEGVTAHLFLFDPTNGQFVRISNGEWRDIHPAVGPDGRQVAFASNRDGVWDLYLLDLLTGTVQRLTDTPEYDGSPSWSPDGLWLAYESYVPKEDQGDLEIFIRQLDGSGEPIRLTDDPAADHSPDWSSQGRKIAFVSTRTGDADIWMADLDQVDNRYQNVSRTSDANEAHPAWSPDGERLAWSSKLTDGIQVLMVWSLTAPELRPNPVNNGEWSAWSADGKALLASIRSPNHVYLTGYSLLDEGLMLPIRPLDGDINGVAGGSLKVADPMLQEMAVAGIANPTPLWIPLKDETANLPGERSKVTELVGMDGAGLMLHELVDDSFYALRAKTAEQIGWDFLSSLESAYIPLTAPPDPGLGENWLYTGRSFKFNQAPASAGWLALVREDYGAQTYWRVYLRTRFQDGSQGAPLKDLPWDLAARHSGDVVAYEQGGEMASTPPPGYWIDFTRLAAAYGWERLPAFFSWRGAFSGVRFNEFVLRDGLDWINAMLQIYPQAALDTPTPVSSPTMTSTASNTPVPSPTYTRTPYRSRTPTPTQTRRPTRTPTPTATRWPTRTPTSTQTPRPTRTPTPGGTTPTVSQ